MKENPSKNSMKNVMQEEGVECKGNRSPEFRTPVWVRESLWKFSYLTLLKNSCIYEIMYIILKFILLNLKLGFGEIQFSGDKQGVKIFQNSFC